MSQAPPSSMKIHSGAKKVPADGKPSASLPDVLVSTESRDPIADNGLDLTVFGTLVDKVGSEMTEEEFLNNYKVNHAYRLHCTQAWREKLQYATYDSEKPFDRLVGLNNQNCRKQRIAGISQILSFKNDYHLGNGLKFCIIKPKYGKISYAADEMIHRELINGGKGSMLEINYYMNTMSEGVLNNFKNSKLLVQGIDILQKKQEQEEAKVDGSNSGGVDQDVEVFYNAAGEETGFRVKSSDDIDAQMKRVETDIAIDNFIQEYKWMKHFMKQLAEFDGKKEVNPLNPLNLEGYDKADGYEPELMGVGKMIDIEQLGGWSKFVSALHKVMKSLISKKVYRKGKLNASDHIEMSFFDKSAQCVVTWEVVKL